jgi:tetratricopeptide (TPR) repeat protein
MTEMTKGLDYAIGLAKSDEYLQALTLFLETYGTDDSPPIRSPKDAAGLSYFGLCLALVKKDYKTAVELCKRAIDLEFYNGDHYANLARVYAVAGNRKKAVATADSGLKLQPENDLLRATRRALGVRSRPTVPFLDRAHPINVSLGQTRHAKKVAERVAERKRKKTRS